MPTSPAFLDWQAAESVAQAAARACNAMVDRGRSPTREQWEEVKRLREIASEKLQIMMAELRRHDT